MYRFWGARLAVLAAAGLLALWPATAAWAATIDINDGNVPTTAAEYEDQECSANQGGGPYPGEDIWVFVLPKNNGDFVSVTATFGLNGSLSVPPNGGILTDNGASKAWIKAPAGWTLTAATAEVTGTATSFNLTHTCPATSSPSPSTSPSPSPTPEPSETPTPSPSTSVTVRPSGAPQTGGGGGATGTGGMAIGVGALTLAAVSGAGLALARRRRRGA